MTCFIAEGSLRLSRLYRTGEKIKAQRAISAQVSEREAHSSCVPVLLRGVRGRMIVYSEDWETEAHIVRTAGSAQAS